MQNLYQNKDIKMVIEDNQCLKNDVLYLQNILGRFNERLNCYITKFGKLPEDEDNFNKKRKCKKLTRENIYHLNSLVLAYDELIQEKTEALKAAESQLSKAAENIYNISKENEELMFYIENFLKENANSYGNEINSHEQAIAEERSLLCEENSRLKKLLQKSRTTIGHQENEMKEIQRQLNELQLEGKNCRDEMNSLNEENRKLQRELTDSVPYDQHHNSVNECNKLLAELKYTYNERTGSIEAEVKDVKMHNNSLNDKLFHSVKNVKGLQFQAISYKTSLRKTIVHQRKQNVVLRELKLVRHALKIKLQNLQKICSELVKDRKSILSDKEQATKETKIMRATVEDQSSAIGILTVKLKDERLQFKQKLCLSEGQKQAAIIAWKKSSKNLQKVLEDIQDKQKLHFKD